jgi:hypothetical protein
VAGWQGLKLRLAGQRRKQRCRKWELLLEETRRLRARSRNQLQFLEAEPDLALVERAQNLWEYAEREQAELAAEGECGRELVLTWHRALLELAWELSRALRRELARPKADLEQDRTLKRGRARAFASEELDVAIKLLMQLERELGWGQQEAGERKPLQWELMQARKM